MERRDCRRRTGRGVVLEDAELVSLGQDEQQVRGLALHTQQALSAPGAQATGAAARGRTGGRKSSIMEMRP